MERSGGCITFSLLVSCIVSVLVLVHPWVWFCVWFTFILPISLALVFSFMGQCKSKASLVVFHKRSIFLKRFRFRSILSVM